MADTADPFGLHTDPVLPPLIDLGGSFVIEAVLTLIHFNLEVQDGSNKQEL